MNNILYFSPSVESLAPNFHKTFHAPYVFVATSKVKNLLKAFPNLTGIPTILVQLLIKLHIFELKLSQSIRLFIILKSEDGQILLSCSQLPLQRLYLWPGLHQFLAIFLTHRFLPMGLFYKLTFFSTEKLKLLSDVPELALLVLEGGLHLPYLRL